MTEETMKDVDHTHPHTGEAFGNSAAYQRGPAVAADGGQAHETESMKDVTHESPVSEGVARVYERGFERTDESE
jgi:hypothetical protein